MIHAGPLRVWHERCINALAAGGARLDTVMQVPGVEIDRLRVLRNAPMLRPVDQPPDVSRVTARDGTEALQAVRERPLEFVLDLSLGAAGRLQPQDHRLWRFDRQAEALPGVGEVAAGYGSAEEVLEEVSPDGRHRVLRRGTHHVFGYSASASVDAILRSISEWPALARSDEARGVCLASSATAGAQGAHSTARSPSLALLAVRQGIGVAARMRRLVKSDSWDSGLILEPVTSVLGGAAPEIMWLPDAARNRYFADPFVVSVDDVIHVIVEEYDYSKDRGRLVRISREASGDFRGPVTLAELPHHLSYPYLFRVEGRLYCTPEAAQSREVALYEVDEHNWNMRKAATLVCDFAGVDPTVVRAFGRWWLFATDADRGPDSHLMAWHASDLVGPWTPHEGNPIKVDVSSARPAGTPFWIGGDLIRPAQDCTDEYGGALVLNRLLCLSPTDFAEEPIILPGDSHHRLRRVHTLSNDGMATAIDRKRRGFDVANIHRKALNRTRRARRAGSEFRREHPSD